MWNVRVTLLILSGCAAVGVMAGSARSGDALQEGAVAKGKPSLKDIKVIRSDRYLAVLNLSADGSQLLASFVGLGSVSPLSEDHPFVLLKPLNDAGVAPARSAAGGEGVVDRDGRWIIEPEYLFLHGHDGFITAIHERDSSRGLLNAAAEWVIEPGSYESVAIYRNGYCGVRKGGKWGFVDHTGELVIEPRWTHPRSFFNDLCLIENDPRPRYINTSGEVVIELEEGVTGSSFSEGYARFRLVRPWDNPPPPPKAFFEFLNATEDERAEVEELWKPDQLRAGFINTEGEVVIPAEWGEAGDFAGGRAAVRRVGDRTWEAMAAEPGDLLWGFIDTEGEVVIEPQFERVRAFRDSVAVFYEGRFAGAIDRDGQIIVPARQFHDIDVFAGDVGIAVRDFELVVIDREGRVLIETGLDAEGPP